METRRWHDPTYIPRGSLAGATAGDRILWLALVVLAADVERVRHAALVPNPSTRLALAVAHSFSRSGERAPFESFWLQAVTPSVHYSEEIGSYSRSTHLMTQLRGVMRAVGYEPCVAIEQALHDAARKYRPRDRAGLFNPLTQQVEPARSRPPPGEEPS